MRSRTKNWIQFGIVLACIAGTQTGCKSGWKMPSADMFSWGRKPDSTVIGNGPSVTTPGSASSGLASKTTGTPPSTNTAGPTSPALRSTPNPINSTALNPTTPRPNPNGFGGYGPNTSAPPVAGPNNTTPMTAGPTAAGPYGSLAGTAPVPGGAAASNGYSTGAYSTNQSRPMGVPNGAFAQNPPVNNLPSPQMPVAQNNVPNQPIPGGQGFSYPLPSSPAPQGPSLVAAPPNTAMPGTGAPNGFNMIPPPAGTIPPPSIVSGNPYLPAGPQSVPALPVSSGPSLPPSSPAITQMPTAYGGTAPSSMPNVAPNTAARNGAYQPGSIGRATSYDFSNQGPGALPPASTNSLPRTANDPNGGFNR